MQEKLEKVISYNIGDLHVHMQLFARTQRFTFAFVSTNDSYQCTMYMNFYTQKMHLTTKSQHFWKVLSSYVS